MTTNAPVHPRDLLATYRPGASSFLSAPSGTLLASGVRASLPREEGTHAWQRLPARVDDLLAPLRDDPGALVVGAIPFDQRQAPYLVVPEVVRSAGPLPYPARPAAMVPADPDARWQVWQQPSPDTHAAIVAAAVDRIASGPLEKVVLSRSARITVPYPVDVAALVRQLAALDPTVYVFAVDLPRTAGAPSRTFLGASPELLVRRRGTRVVAHPQAGTARRGRDEHDDRERARALLASPKDRHEHEVVVRAVADALRPYCRSLEVPAPALAATGTVWHLATRIEGELADPATTSLELACALHPSPAVCGTPTELARQTIDELEPFDRGCYTGLVGWTDAVGDGEWVIAIRSAEVSGRELCLYAGGGIVAGSDPSAEVDETSAKFRTMLDALGVALDL